MEEAVIIDAVRTPIGRYKGVLKNIRPDDMAAIVIDALVSRNPKLRPEHIQEVVMGNANQAGEDNRNVARMSALLAGLPVSVAGVTVNRLCGSGLDAIVYAARSIMTGEGDVFIAGGTESMSRAPYVMAKPESDFPRGNMELFDTTIGWRFINPRLQHLYGTDSMPETAENVARTYGVSREEQDAFALSSQQKARKAVEEGRFMEEIVPVTVPSPKGDPAVIQYDEHPRPGTTMEKLSALKPLFAGGTVTAGNSSGVNDGASALLMMSLSKARKLGLRPLAKYRASAVVGLEPSVMGLGPIGALKAALERAGARREDAGLYEINEAFASQALECIRQLEINPEIVNVNGGAIALGHPLGASGARIMTALLYEMKRRRVELAAAAMCIGVGQGIAAVIENME